MTGIPEPGPNSPASWTAAGIRDAVACKQLSVRDVARRAADRIAARENEVRAWSHFDRAALMQAAERLDRASPKGLLHGTPVGIKDNILTRDMPTRAGSLAYDGFMPGMDAACVRLLRGAGAILAGKTHTVEFASTGRPAPTRNPRNLSHTPGGSSSGSAAAVADGHVPVALGTQTGGSIIRPASFCGVWAVKPSWNLVSLEGVKPFAPSLDTLGWFAGSPEDLGLIYKALLHAWNPEPVPDLDGLPIGLCRTPLWSRAEPATIAALNEARRSLEAQGAELVELELPDSFAGLPDAHVTIMQSEGQTAFLADLRAHPGALSPGIRKYAEITHSRQDIVRAYDLVARCREIFDREVGRFSAILAPSAVGEAPVGLASTGDYAFNGIWTVLHAPCVNVPGLVGPSGLPVGLSVVGPRLSDARTLAVAAAVGGAIGSRSA